MSQQEVVSWLITFGIGALMSIGVSLSGMTNIQASWGFFDVLSYRYAWDPSMGITFCVALGITFALWKSITQSSKPWLAHNWDLPTNSSHIDQKMILGTILFGAGWAIGGFCPGPAVAMAAVGQPTGILFTVAMFLGWHVALGQSVGKLGIHFRDQLIWILVFSSLLIFRWYHPMIGGWVHVSGFSISRCVLGGVLISVAVLANCKLNGRVLGLSGLFGGLVHPGGTDVPYRAAFTSGFFAGAMYLATVLPQQFVTGVSPSQIHSILGGFLVGYGTKTCSGCTSGHGLAGIARRSPRSFYATLMFMGAATLAVNILIRVF